MPEEVKTENQEQGTDHQEDSKPDFVEIRKGEYEGLKTQIKKMKEQLGSFESMKEQIEKEKSEAEKKKLLEAEKFEEVKSLFEKEKEDLSNQLQSLKQETVAKDLKFQLAQKGLKHDKAMKMFVQDYLSSGSEMSLDDYVASVVSDETNKVFFEQEPVRRPGDFAPGVSSSSANTSKSLAERLAKGEEAAVNEVASMPDNKRQEIIELSRKLVRG